MARLVPAEHRCPMPAWVQAAIALSTSMVMVTCLVLVWYGLGRLPHADIQTGKAIWDSGFWWCLGGTFGNGCWYVP